MGSISAVMIKPAAATEGHDKGDRTVVVVESKDSYRRHEGYFHHHRRIWIPGHWEFNHFGYRYWVPGHYEYRYF